MDGAVERMLEQIKTLTVDQREEFFRQFKKEYCPGCGGVPDCSCTFDA